MAEIEPQRPLAERPAESPQSGGVSSVAGKARARSERHTMASIENVIPILRVEDLEVSRRYYMQELGFALDWD
jgi:hypothetical protein